MKFATCFIVSSTVFLATSALGLVGPSPYLQQSDSPWASLHGNGTFFVEDFEDGQLNTPGVVASHGQIQNPGNLTDSVDGDDHSLDGSGKLGRSWFMASATNGVRFTFSSGPYGALPTHAGVVWTDGSVNGTTRFEAFDAAGVSLGVISGVHTDGNFAGGTAEDRFYGWVHSAGIGSILMTHGTSGGLEVDHLQYGTVPEPGTITAIGLGLVAMFRRRKLSK